MGSWNGHFEDEALCIDDTNERLYVLENLPLKAVINKNATVKSGSIDKFPLNLSISFSKEDESKKATVSIDFTLFELICDMDEGYRPTIQDKNRHTDFVSFIQQLIDFGDKDKRITIIPKNGETREKRIFRETEFGYEFKVVRQ